MKKKTFQISNQITTARVENGVVLLNLLTGEFFGLEGTAVRFWELLSTTGSFEETVRNIVEEYEVHTTEVKVDLKAFIEQLKEAGLVTS
jgi:hypothetical protein